MKTVTSSPLTRRELIDEYFIEHRTKLLDIAAFLDRLDRTSGADRDFRLEAFVAALEILCTRTERVCRIQMLLSDPRLEPLERLDRKSAVGAYDRWTEGHTVRPGSGA